MPTIVGFNSGSGSGCAVALFKSALKGLSRVCAVPTEPMAATAVRAITSAMTRFQDNGMFVANRLNTDFYLPRSTRNPPSSPFRPLHLGTCCDNGLFVHVSFRLLTAGSSSCHRLVD